VDFFIISVRIKIVRIHFDALGFVFSLLAGRGIVSLRHCSALVVDCGVCEKIPRSGTFTVASICRIDASGGMGLVLHRVRIPCCARSGRTA
jgi:hypothetical protein